jgi:hypothetical protein
MTAPAQLPPFVEAAATPSGDLRAAELRRVTQMLDDRLDGLVGSVPARLRGLIPAALTQLAIRRSPPSPT